MEASVEATNHGMCLLYLRRGILNNWNRNLGQEDYEVGKLSNSIAAHLLTPNLLASLNKTRLLFVPRPVLICELPKVEGFL